MPQIVPTQAVASQTFQVQLANQICQINLRTRGVNGDFGLFMDLFLFGDPIVQGVVCQNQNRIVRDLYLGFSGDFAFFDTQGSDDPFYTGLGSRFQLAYFSAAELPAGVG